LAYSSPILSEAAEELLKALQRERGRMLCFTCAAGETDATVYEARKAIRELILNGLAIVSPNEVCSACHHIDFATILRTGR
jgi:hypothetical protein